MVRNPLFTASMHLVEQWLGLLTDLGRANATIKAYRGALTHYLRYCEANSIHPPSARFEDFSAYLRPQLPGMAQPAASATLQLRISAIRLWYSIFITGISVKPVRYPGQCCPARCSADADWYRVSPVFPVFLMIMTGLLFCNRPPPQRYATV